MKVSDTQLTNARLGSTNINFSRIATAEVWDRTPTSGSGEIVSGVDGFLTIGVDNFLIGTWGGEGYATATFSPDDYGAVGDGVTDDTAAFTAMHSAIMAAQDAEPGLRVTIEFTTNAHYVYSWNKWSWGIRYLTIEGNNATIQNVFYNDYHTIMMTWWTNAGVVENNQVTPLGFLIDTASIGNTFVTLKSASDASEFVVGRWVIICSYSQQTGGWPPNTRYFDYAKVSSISGVVINLDRSLTHKHRDNWPSRGYSNEIDVARIIPAEQDIAWGDHWIVKNLNALVNPNWVNGSAVQIEGFDRIEFIGVDFEAWSAGQGREMIFNGSTTEICEPDKMMTKLRFEDCSVNFSQGSGVDVIEMVNCTSVGVLFFGRRLYIDGCSFSGATIAGPPVAWWDPLSVGGFTPVEYVEVKNTTFDSAGHPTWPALKGTYNIERAIGSTGFTLSGTDIIIDQNYAAAWDNDGLINRIYEGQRLMLTASDRSRKGYGDVISIESNGSNFTARIGVEWSEMPVDGDIVIQYGVMELIATTSPLVDTFVDGATPNEGIAYNIWNGVVIKDVWTVTPP